MLSKAGAAGLLRSLGVRPEGRFSLRLDMPARVALARAAGVADPKTIVLACLGSEGAVDPLMLDDPEGLLWASRAGRVLARPPAPSLMEIVGRFFGPMRRTDPRDAAFPDIADHSDAWPAACGDLAGVAALASESARRTIRLRGPADDPTETLAAAKGALGFVIAHTGAAGGLIFAPGTVPETTPAALRASGFRHILRFRIRGGR